LVSAGRVHEAHEELAHADTLLQATPGHLLSATDVHARHILFRLLAGRFDEAEGLINELLNDANPAVGTLYGIAMSRVRTEQGRLAELEPLIRELVESSQAVAWRARLGAMYVELGRLDEAQEQLDTLLGTLDLSTEVRAAGWAITAAYLAEIARALRAVDLAG